MYGVSSSPHIIVFFICALFVLVVLASIISNNSATHNTHEPFNISPSDMFKLSYDKISPTCYDLAQKLQIDVSGLTDSQVAALKTIANNTYVTGSGDTYGTNQCVIPRNVATDTYKIDNCLISSLAGGDTNTIQLETNPTFSNIDAMWDIQDGCVINNDLLKSKIKDIAKKLDDNTKYLSQKAVETINNATTALQQQTTNLNSQTTAYNTTTSQNNYYTQVATIATFNETQLASAAMTQTVQNQNLASQYNISAQRATEFANFVADKIIGIRWYVYTDYFEPGGQAFLDNMWNGNIMPYDGGLTTRIDGFDYLTDQTGTYKQYTYTQNTTYLFEFLFRPDVSGTWGFELTSDDASYMWLHSNDDYSEPMGTSILGSGTNPLKYNGSSNLLINNGGLHAMTAKTATKDLSANGTLYKIRIVFGNWKYTTDPTMVQNNGQGIRLRVRRPGSTSYFVLTSGNSGFGAPSDEWFNKYMTFEYYKKGMLAKVYSGYFNDNANFFRNTQPLTLTRLRQAYNMRKDFSSIPPGHGFNKTDSFDKNIELVMTTNHLSNPTKVKLYPFGWGCPGSTCYTSSDGTLRTISLFGYFKAPITGSYTFYFAGDDAAYMWFGSDAKETVVTGKSTAFDKSMSLAAVKLPGTHGTQSQPFKITLTQGTLTPIRIVQGDAGATTTLLFGYERPDGEVVYDLTVDFVF